MEEQTMLKQILGALQGHSEEINSRIDDLESKMNTRINDLESSMNTRINDLESRMDTGFDQLGKKFDGMRVELTETQETTDFVLSKTAQHEKKFHQFTNQE